MKGKIIKTLKDKSGAGHYVGISIGAITSMVCGILLIAVFSTSIFSGYFYKFSNNENKIQVNNVEEHKDSLLAVSKNVSNDVYTSVKDVRQILLKDMIKGQSQISVKVSGSDTYGYNLCPGFEIKTTTIARGVTITPNADGSITLNGTSTGAGYIYGKDFQVYAGMSLVATGCDSNSGTGCSAMILSSGWSKKLSLKSTTDTSPVGDVYQQKGIPLEFYIVADTKISYCLWVNTGRTFVNETIRPMIYAGSIKKENVCPGFGLTAPETKQGITFVPNADGSVTLNGTSTGAGYLYGIEFPANSKTQYTLNGTYSSVQNGCSIIMITYWTNSGWDVSVSKNSDSDSAPLASVGQYSNTPVTFYTTKATRLKTCLYYTAGKTFSNLTILPQMVIGSTTTSDALGYEKYSSSQTLSNVLKKNLCQVNETSYGTISGITVGASSTPGHVVLTGSNAGYTKETKHQLYSSGSTYYPSGQYTFSLNSSLVNVHPYIEYMQKDKTNWNLVYLATKNPVTISSNVPLKINAGAVTLLYNTYSSADLAPKLEFSSMSSSFAIYDSTASSLLFSTQKVKNPVLKVCGKNLIPSPYNTSAVTHNGITYVANSDGSISASGTASGDSVASFLQTSQGKKLPAGTYTFSAAQDGTGSLGARLELYDSSGTRILNKDICPSVNNGYKSSIVNNEFSSYLMSFSMFVLNGNTVDCTLYPQLELGEQASAYEQYKAPKTYSYPISLENGNSYTFKGVDASFSPNCSIFVSNDNSAFGTDANIAVSYIANKNSKNLLSEGYFSGSQVIGGVTYSCLNDGSFSVSGTSNGANSSYWFSSVLNPIVLTPGKYELKVKGGADTTKLGTVYKYTTDNGDTWSEFKFGSSKKTEFNFTKITKLAVGVYVTGTNTVDSTMTPTLYKTNPKNNLITKDFSAGSMSVSAIDYSERQDGILYLSGVSDRINRTYWVASTANPIKLSAGTYNFSLDGTAGCSFLSSAYRLSTDNGNTWTNYTYGSAASTNITVADNTLLAVGFYVGGASPHYCFIYPLLVKN